jgi:hypothetical protein
MSTNLAIWWSVPNGSKIELWVSGGGEDISARARILMSNDAMKEIPHGELVPGPAVQIVENNLTYTARPAVVFQSSDNQIATIHAKLIGPDGGVIPDSNGESEYAYNVQGEAGDNPARATLSFVNQGA